MSVSSEKNEYGSFAKEVAALLDINTNTLRRWSIELEKQGYVFERNEKEQRIYYKRDVMAFKQMQNLIADKTSVVNASMEVSKRHINSAALEQTLGVDENRSVQITFTREDLEQVVQAAIMKERESMFRYFEEKMNNQMAQRDQHLLDAIQKNRIGTEKTKEVTKISLFSRIFKR